MAIWCVLAQPLQASVDFRNISDASAAVLLNPHAIDIDQDALGQMGVRLESDAAPLQRWWRRLANDDVAVVLLNRHGAPEPCHQWAVNHTGYLECCGGGCCDAFSNLTLAAAEAACCAAGSDCAGLSFPAAAAAAGLPGDGCYKSAINCFQPSTGFVGASKAVWPPAPSPPADIAVNFTDVGFRAGERVSVFDVWAQQTVGVFTDSFTAHGVAFHGNAFLRLSRA